MLMVEDAAACKHLTITSADKPAGVQDAPVPVSADLHIAMLQVSGLTQAPMVTSM